MGAGILLLAVVCLSLQNIGYKLVSRYVKSQSDTVLCSGIIVSMVAVLSCLFTIQSFTWDGMTVLLGSVFGLFFALCEFSYMMALATGPMSYTSLFLSCALVIPAAAGVVFWQETLAGGQIAGILLLVVSFALGLTTEAGGGKVSARWLVFGVLTFLSNGMVSVMQKAQQVMVGEERNGEFMVVSFTVATVLLWSLYFLRKGRGRGGAALEKGTLKKLLPFAAVAAAASAGGNQLALYAAAQIDAGVMFPVMNGGILILCSLTAVVFFKERLTKRQWVGIALGVASVLLISL